MAIDEIEIPESSRSFTVYGFSTDISIDVLLKLMQEPEEHFSLDPERPGFHDLESDGKTIRGYFSVVAPFEVEKLVDGMTAKVLEKRIESCEFILSGDRLWAWGKSSAKTNLARRLTPLAGFGITPITVEQKQMSAFYDRLSMVHGISLRNPKDREVRTARLTGRIESYLEYKVVDPCNHGIEKVCGLLDTPLGPLTVTVGTKGSLNLKVRRGFIMTLDCLVWLNSMILDEQKPEAATK